MMDVSGSMGEEQKELVRPRSFGSTLWLRKNYEALRAATSSTTSAPRKWTSTRSMQFARDGGTKISSAFRTCKQLLDAHYSPERVEHLPVPLLRRRQQLRSRFPRLRQAAQGATAIPHVQYVRLLPGRQRLRLRQLYQRPPRAPAQPRKGADEPRQQQGRYLRLDPRRSSGRGIEAGSR